MHTKYSSIRSVCKWVTSYMCSVLWLLLSLLVINCCIVKTWVDISIIWTRHVCFSVTGAFLHLRHFDVFWLMAAWGSEYCNAFIPPEEWKQQWWEWFRWTQSYERVRNWSGASTWAVMALFFSMSCLRPPSPYVEYLFPQWAIAVTCLK